MTRAALAALFLLGSALAGCIQPPQHDDPMVQAAAAPPPGAFRGMTATENHTDRAVSCADGSTVALPQACWERDLTVTGRLGLDELPLDLVGANAPLRISTSAGDAWSFHAVVRVVAPTDDAARQGLDSAWAWSHTDGARHFLHARPTPAGSLPPDPAALGLARVVSARYELSVPAWVPLTGHAQTSNGPILAAVTSKGLSLETSNGGVNLAGTGGAVSVLTSNGGIEATYTPTSSGAIRLETSNGAIVAVLPAGAARGYDVDAKTSNARVSLRLTDADAQEQGQGYGSAHAHATTRGFSARAVQASVSLETSNAAIVASG